MSLMNMRNRIGPRTVPWGTPLIIRAIRNRVPSTTTNWVLFVRIDSTQFTIFG